MKGQDALLQPEINLVRACRTAGFFVRIARLLQFIQDRVNRNAEAVPGAQDALYLIAVHLPFAVFGSRSDLDRYIADEFERAVRYARGHVSLVPLGNASGLGARRSTCSQSRRTPDNLSRLDLGHGSC